MNRIVKKNGHDLLIYFAVTFLSVFGIVMIGSATVTIAIDKGPIAALINVFKQVLFVFSGYILMFGAYRLFRVKKYNKYIYLLYGLVIIGLFICLVYEDRNGAKAWIYLGSFTLQPSEFSKVILILLLSHMFSTFPGMFKKKSHRSRDDFNNYKRKKMLVCLGIPLIIAAIVVGIVAILQKDLGSAVIILLLCLICFFAANNPYFLRFQAITLVGGVVGAVFLFFASNTFLKGFQIKRISSWLNPLDDPFKSSYQLINALIAFVNGGLFGVGLGNSTQKYGYIPESHNDFIGSIIFEELGIFGLAIIIAGYYIIISRLVKYSLKVEESKSKIILMGIAAYFFLHLFVNLGGISGLIPMTGVPLLFVSYGGSSTWSAFIAIGIAQSIISTYNKSLATNA